MIWNNETRTTFVNESFDKIKPLLKSYAVRICGDADDAEDIIQDILLKFISMSTDHIENPRSFLIRMVINSSINFKKKTERQKMFNNEAALQVTISPDFSDAVILKKEALMRSLTIILEKLSPGQQAVFILKEGYDYNHDEIAALLGISAEVSRQHLSRAKKKISTRCSLPAKMIPTAHLNRYFHILQLGDSKSIEDLVAGNLKGSD